MNRRLRFLSVGFMASALVLGAGGAPALSRGAPPSEAGTATAEATFGGAYRLVATRVVGIALEALEGGTGLIPVFVSLR